MEEINKLDFSFSKSDNFDVMIKRSTLYKDTHFYEIDIHSHEELEIYINLSGDISFWVKNRMYDVNRGDVIIAHPKEFHHCIYRSNAKHNHFWLLINLQENTLLKDLFAKELAVNYIHPSLENRERIITICDKLVEVNQQGFDQLYVFLQFMDILKKSALSLKPEHETQKRDIATVLEYIDRHLFERINSKDLAKVLFVSESTLSRMFKLHLHTTPLEYINQRKCVVGAELLSKGVSVQNVAETVGFFDVSYFIQIFKRHYGMTPLEYKKKNYHHP